MQCTPNVYYTSGDNYAHLHTRESYTGARRVVYKFKIEICEHVWKLAVASGLLLCCNYFINFLCFSTKTLAS